MEIVKLGSNQTIDFACAELSRYLQLFYPQQTFPVLAEDACSDTASALFVGISPAFDQHLPAVSDRALDDGIYIHVENGAGMITGTNPRSVLIAVYRFLKELGVCWIRPGPDGELLPDTAPAHCSVHVAEAAAYRHRAICIEGAISIEHANNILDWIPKASMNGYFIQFRLPYIFFDRWYSHLDNPTMAPEPISREMVFSFQRQMEDEIAKRGLLYHTVGHSWTCEPFGIEGNGWYPVEDNCDDSTREMFAMVNGKRALWDGIPLNTALCYSNPKVRQIITDAVVDYCRGNPQADYVHFWLDDGANNNCECENCQKKLPSDFYIDLLNEIDEKLTEEGIPTRIVFLLYMDLLWINRTDGLHNPDRFLMMFAPITRSYTDPYVGSDMPQAGETVPYVRNKLVFPRKVGDNLAYLQAWQRMFQGDSVDFDYHLMWDHLRDTGYYRCAEVLFTDAQNLVRIGINGYISCQLQRAAFPTGLPMEMMARALWGKHAIFEEEATNYFRQAFGKDGEAARKYLEQLSQEFVPPYVRGEWARIDPQIARQLEAAKSIVTQFLPVIEENLQTTGGNLQRSWLYLQYHSTISLMFADLLIAAAQGEIEKQTHAFEALKAYVCSIEPEVHTVFDVYFYIDILKRFMTGTIQL